MTTSQPSQSRFKNPQNLKKTPIWWWTTPKGKSLSAGIITLGGMAAFCATYLPEYFYSEEYVDFVHLYKSGLKVDVSDEVKSLVNKCGDILGFSEEKKSFIKPFTVLGFDLFTIGSLKSRYNAHIGIPEYYNYNSVLDIRRDDIQINNKPVNWNLEEAEAFSDALVLTEGEKKFSLCREILMTEGYKTLIDSLYPTFTLYGGYNACRIINTKYNLYSFHISTRIVLYSLMSTFCLGVYFLLKDSLQWYYEGQADQRLAKLGPEFVNNGVSFYSKLSERNKALRVLMGDEGKSIYTIKGDEYRFYRSPHLPITDRKKYFESLLQNKE